MTTTVCRVLVVVIVAVKEWGKAVDCRGICVASKTLADESTRTNRAWCVDYRQDNLRSLLAIDVERKT